MTSGSRIDQAGYGVRSYVAAALPSVTQSHAAAARQARLSGPSQGNAAPCEASHEAKHHHVIVWPAAALAAIACAPDDPLARKAEAMPPYCYPMGR